MRTLATTMHTDVVNFFCFQAFLLYVHYMRENVRALLLYIHPSPFL